MSVMCSKAKQKISNELLRVALPKGHMIGVRRKSELNLLLAFGYITIIFEIHKKDSEV